jgi:amino acid transporter
MSNTQILARRTLGAGALWVFGVSASSPLTVLVGGIVATYALTGVVGVPLSFGLITVVVGLLAVGYLAMSRHVVSPAPFYAVLGRGLGRSVGVSGALVALLAYNAIQISLYGLIGVTVVGLVGGTWWVWAGFAWLALACLGLLGGAANSKILGSLLAVEIAVIILFDIAAFANPAGGSISLAGLDPSNLIVPGAAGAFAFAMAALTGAETPAAYSEEARPGTVAKATFSGVVFLGVLYLFTALAYSVSTGPANVATAAQDPSQAPFALLGTIFGPGIITIATVLLVTSVLAAMAAFHNTVARYVFAAAREQVLPPSFAKVSTGSRGGVPLAGSLLQSAIAAVVVAIFVVLGADPMAVMFTWLSTLGGLCVLVLLMASAVASRKFFAEGGGANEGIFVRQVAPVGGLVLGVLVLAFTLSNLNSLLGVEPGSPLPWIVPGAIITTMAIGLMWGAVLRRTRPIVHDAIGEGAPDTLLAKDHALQDAFRDRMGQR